MSDEQGARAALAASAAAFGRYLRQERELRGLSRDEVSALTKLTPALVEALESGEPERMPPHAYVQGYLRSYAGAVGLDPDDAVLRWQEVAGVEERPARRARGPALRLGLLVALALALAALVGLTLLGHEPREVHPSRAHDVGLGR